MWWHSWIVVLSLGQAEPASLTPKQQADVHAAAAEFRQGSHLAAVQKLAPLLIREETTAAVDADLRRQDLPGVGELMAQARLEAVRDGLAAKLPRPGRGELLVLLPAYKQLLQEQMDQVITQPAMGNVLPVPDKLEGFQDLFTQLDQCEGRIDHLGQAAGYLRTLTRAIPKTELEKLPDELRAMAENDEAGSLVGSLESLRRGVDERRIELSIKRLGVAMNVLAQPQLTVRNLLAASVWNSDLHRATTFLKKSSPKSLLRPALREEGLVKRLLADGEKVRRTAGPLTIKAGLLQDGLQWWLRGRFGAGPEIMGLVKSQQAVRSPEGRVQLRLPPTLTVGDPFGRPEPTKSLVPFYHRRHLYTWSWNNRYVYTSGWTYEKHFQANPQLAPRLGREPFSPAPLLGATPADERAGQIQRMLAENENENLLRLVGYVEYTYALGRLDQLLRTVSEAELAVMDQWVKEQDSLAIYVNLSRKFPQVATTAFGEWVVAPDDNYQRRGLDWVVALARIELAAMRAAFAGDHDAFQSLRPTAYENKAYEELLLDSMRLHLWGLQADPLFLEQNLRKAAAGNDSVALIYDRRVRLAIAFIDAARQWLGPRIAGGQRRELQTYRDKLVELDLFIRRELLHLGGDGGLTNPVKQTPKTTTTPAKTTIAPAKTTAPAKQ